MGVSISTIFAIVAFSYVFINIYKRSINGTFGKNTVIAGIDIEGKTPAEAKQIFNNIKDLFLNKQIKFSLKDKSINIPLNELAIDIQVDQTIDLLKTRNTTNQNIFDLFFVKNDDVNINLITKINNSAVIKYLEDSFEISDIRALNANYYFNENDDLSISNENAGFQINQKPLLTALSNSFSTLKPSSISLELIEETPLVTKLELEKNRSKVVEKLSTSLTFVDPIYSDNWYIKLINYSDWVTFNTDTEGTTIGIKQEKLDEFTDEEISKWLDLPAEDVNIYKDENEEIIIDGRGNDGKAIKRDLFKQSIELALKNDEYEVIIPIEKISPQIKISEDLQKLGIKERIAVGHTSYYGSHTNRIHNIKTGASKFNGTIIAPDEIFSFTQTLGPVDASTGYKKELVIKAEGTIPEYGGGLCQVSTTMYRSILLGGLPLVERHPHSYKVSYYSQVLGDGLDATIYIGGPDLKFQNDTENHILVQAYVKDDYELYIVFYGTSDGRSVELEGPYLSNYHSPGATVYIDSPSLLVGQTKQVEVRHTGFNALWYRHLTNKDGETVVETLNTAYRAIPAKILRGTALPQ